MDIKDIGKVVANGRVALGLTQEQLAHFSGLSRVTVNELENGTIVELGVTKVAAILAVLGVHLTASPNKPKNNGLSIAAVTASVSYKDNISAAALMKALVTGAYPAKYLPHIATLIDEAPIQMLTTAVKEASERSGVAPKKIWQHVTQWARDLQSPRSVWQ
jgi:transcriptional regulator with XRE-family HTH domain